MIEYVLWPIDGVCFACHRPNRDHTIVELVRCLDAPLAIEIVKEADQDQ